MVVELEPHQQRAVEQLNDGNILCGGVGSGKTVTSLAYYFTRVCGGVIGDPGFTDPIFLYVVTTAKTRDGGSWQRWAREFGMEEMSLDEVGGDFGGDERCAACKDASGSCGSSGEVDEPCLDCKDDRGGDASNTSHNCHSGKLKFHVTSWNLIGRLKNVTGAFFIFDEQRLVGSGAWTKAFYKIAANNRWILLSATPGDNWLDYIPVFVANGFYRNRTEFKRRHVVYKTYSKFPQVDHYVDVGLLVRRKNRILVDMPYEKHTRRHIHEIETDYNRVLMDRIMKERWDIYEEKPLKDVGAMIRAMRRLANTDHSRVDALYDLIRDKPKLIVFYNFDYELELLRGALDSLVGGGVFGVTRSLSETGEVLERSKFAYSEWNGHKHEPIPDSERWVYLVQYLAGAEGWNCIETNSVAFWSLTYSYKVFEQAMGRIDRLNTPFVDLDYYVLKSKSVIDRMIWKKILNKESFNERSLLAKMG